MVGEKFGWMTERSPVTLLREEKEKAVGQSCSLTCQVTAMRGYLMHCWFTWPWEQTRFTAAFLVQLLVLFFSFLPFRLSLLQCDFNQRQLYWAISWFIWYFCFNEDARWWNWAVNEPIQTFVVSMVTPGSGFMQPSHSSQSWGGLMRETWQSHLRQNETFPNSSIFFSGTSFWAVALHEITQVWF